MKFVAGFVVAILLIPVCVYGYFRFGYAPVATASTPWPFEMQLAHMALHAHLDKDGIKPVPFKATETDLLEGAHLYRQQCAVCHGLVDQAKTPVAAGMYPDPPQLLHGTGVSDDPAGETYWKVANGIRLTGMPAYKQSLSEKQMWEISILLAGSDKLPPAVTEVLRKPVPDI